jgi:hypothetical protein
VRIQGKNTMAIQYFARVKSVSDHEAFQRIVRHYPSCSYEEWHFREAKKMADWRSRRHVCKMVDITPAEFSEYCERTGAKPDISTFLKVLSDKATF